MCYHVERKVQSNSSGLLRSQPGVPAQTLLCTESVGLLKLHQTLLTLVSTSVMHPREIGHHIAQALTRHHNMNICEQVIYGENENQRAGLLAVMSAERSNVGRARLVRRHDAPASVHHIRSHSHHRADKNASSVSVASVRADLCRLTEGHIRDMPGLESAGVPHRLGAQ